MSRFRERAPVALRRNLRSTQRRLERAYRHCEAAVLPALEELVVSPDALSDPGLTSLIVAHRRALQDLERIERIPSWLDVVERIDPKAVRPVSGRLRALAAALCEADGRDAARETLGSFQRQVAAADTLPFETTLRQGKPLAARATGGLHEAYVQSIDRQRRVWAEAWGREDDGGEAGVCLELMWRLNLAMEDAAGALADGGPAERLNRWPPWELDRPTLARVVEQLPSRIKLATASAIEGNADDLARQVERIDRDLPLARLVGRLASVLADPLNELPGGAQGVIGQLRHPPTGDAWLVAWRGRLHDLCRYALEESHARSTGHEAMADELAAYVDGVARELVWEAEATQRPSD
jgi:hypothetical protein